RTPRTSVVLAIGKADDRSPIHGYNGVFLKGVHGGDEARSDIGAARLHSSWPEITENVNSRAEILRHGAASHASARESDNGDSSPFHKTDRSYDLLGGFDRQAQAIRHGVSHGHTAAHVHQKHNIVAWRRVRARSPTPLRTSDRCHEHDEREKPTPCSTRNH